MESDLPPRHFGRRLQQLTHGFKQIGDSRIVTIELPFQFRQLRCQSPLAGDQFLYFRRGSVFVRLLLDPGVKADPASLQRRADQVDQALRQGGRL